MTGSGAPTGWKGVTDVLEPDSPSSKWSVLRYGFEPEED
jgi:hypothetical protein